MTKAQQLEEFIDRLDLRYFRGNEFTPFWLRRTKGVKNSLPNESLWPNIIPTVIVLDELRDELHASIRLLSTYRSPAYNAAVGGEAASFHMKFRAIDFQCAEGSPTIWAKQLRVWRGKRFRLPGNGGYFEFRGGIGLYPTFVHVDTRGYDVDWKG
jgi:uncharacterized protein YcbK (DUF882 family)